MSQPTISHSAVALTLPIGFLLMASAVAPTSLNAQPSTTAVAVPAIVDADAAVMVEGIGVSLVLRPLRLSGRMALRITGPDDFVLERTLPAQDAIAVPLGANSLTDGQYRYEVRLLPEKYLDRAEEGRSSAARDGQESVVAGSFRVENGAIVRPSEVSEPDATASRRRPAGALEAPSIVPEPNGVNLTNGDGIIRNSLCVGFDCPNSPSFSDTTILLMENNTRIKFDDTSTISGFPNRDWQLQANDSTSGGLNRFAIRDCGNSSQGGCSGNIPFTIEGGTPANSVYLDSTGRVGFGTSTPVLQMHTVNSNTPGLRLDQSGSGGFAPQIWDVAGNETNFFVRDVTSGSRLPLRIRPGAPTSSIDINGSGDVGIGTASPAAPVDIVRNGTTNAGFRLENTGGTVPSTWFFSNQSSNGAFIISPTGGAAPVKVFTDATQNSIVIGSKEGTGAQVVGIHKINNLTFPLEVGTNATDGNGAHVTAAGVWTNGSSRVNKIDIENLSTDDALAAVMGLNPVRYKGNGSPDNEEYIGFIAEDVPALVAQNDRASLSPMDIVAVLTKVVQLEKVRNDELEARVAQLEAELARLAALAGGPAPTP